MRWPSREQRLTVFFAMCLTAGCGGAAAAPGPQVATHTPSLTPAIGQPAPPEMPTATLTRPRGRTPTPSRVPTILPATATIADGQTNVQVGDYFFDPRVVTVTVGTTVTWVPVGELVHTIESAETPPVFVGGTSGAGAPAYRFTFSEPGTYAYFCEYHPGEMDGWIVVIEAP